jgi:hypothetical protein
VAFMQRKRHQRGNQGANNTQRPVQ